MSVIVSSDDINKDSKFLYLLGKEHAKWTCRNDDYLAFITPDVIIQKIIALAREHFNGLSDKVIWDMFAGIGSDAIRLAGQAGKVICTEIDADTFSDLKENYAVSCCNNMELHHGDCCGHIGVKCDIIYFDPPWGDTFQSGKEFDFHDVILSNGTSVMDLITTVQKGHSLIIKSPITSNSFDKLFDPEKYTVRLFTFTQQKLKFLFIKK